MADSSTLLPLLATLGEAVTKNFAAAGGNPAQPEDQLKLSLPQFLESAAAAFGGQAVARTEARTDLGVRPISASRIRNC